MHFSFQKSPFVIRRAFLPSRAKLKYWKRELQVLCSEAMLKVTMNSAATKSYLPEGFYYHNIT